MMKKLKQQIEIATVAKRMKVKRMLCKKRLISREVIIRKPSTYAGRSYRTTKDCVESTE